MSYIKLSSELVRIAKDIEITPDLKKQFIRLCGELSPENLACDGECSKAEVKRRYNDIMRRWKQLESKAGRIVSQDEAEDWWIRGIRNLN